MKRRILFFLTVCVILAAAVFGGVKRKTYTNILTEDYLSSVQVAEIPGNMAEDTCAQLEAVLPQMPYILRVETADEIEHLFGASRQKVSVKEIYQGEGLTVGEEIYLYSFHWRLALSESPAALERGFVNILEADTEYLVFLTGQVEDLYSETPIYELYDDALIAPVFCYQDKTNEIVPTSGETTYIPYAKVKDNEFFGEDETAVQAFKQLKEKMIAAYPAL